MKLAIAQLNPTIGDLKGNAQAILTAAQSAVATGAQLLLTPEMSLCGYPPRDLLLRPGFVAAMAETLAQLAQSLPPHLITLVGVALVNPEASQTGGKPLFNSVALLQAGQVQQVFHKRLLPTYDVFDEDRYFEPGNQPNHFYLPQSDGAPPLHIGVTICEDLWNDEQFWGKRIYEINPFAELAELGVDLVINLSASPFTAQKQTLREAMLHHSAARFSLPILYVNQVGGNDDLIFDGNSVAFNRQGKLIGRARGFHTDLMLLEYEPVKQDLTPCEPTTIAPLPARDVAQIWSALVLGVRDYAHKSGFSKAVLGLSGGIDSSLVAAIAAAALGPEQVLGVLMPSPYSSDHSIKDALALAKNLGMQTQTLPIGDLMQGYDLTLTQLFAGTKPDITEENIQSRIRGNLLMAVSNKLGHLLLSTGNKSEMAVGYCTLYGDMNGGLAVIADVPKTKVYELCHWLNQELLVNRLAFPFVPTLSTELIPQDVLTKAPSAELKPGQKDQDSLPPYEILDDILLRLIQQGQTPEQIEAAGHEQDTVRRVARLVARAEFKRRQAPPVLKVTDRAFGMGWRMPIASHWV